MSEPWDATTEYRACYVSNVGMRDKKSEEYERIVAKMMETRDSPAVARAAAPSKDPYEAIVQRKMQEYSQKKKVEAESAEQHEDEVHREEPPTVQQHEAKEAPQERLDVAQRLNLEPQVENERPVVERKRGPRKTFTAAKAHKRRQQQGYRASRQAKRQEDQPSQLVFFRDPEHATVAEQKHLYGPFYVSWPKNKPMPSAYSDLAKIYGRRYQ